MARSTRLRRLLPASLTAALIVGCSRPAPPSVPGTASAGAPAAESAPSAPPPAAKTAAPAVPEFANRIWKVAKGSSGDPGTFYIFLSDGSMLITSPHGTPSVGSWHYSGELLTLVEEGLPHQGTILQSTPDTLALRLSGPGQPVALTFVSGAGK